MQVSQSVDQAVVLAGVVAERLLVFLFAVGAEDHRLARILVIVFGGGNRLLVGGFVVVRTNNRVRTPFRHKKDQKHRGQDGTQMIFLYNFAKTITHNNSIYPI